MATTYRVKMLMLGDCAWKVIPFGSLRDACDFRSKCEAKGWLATLMPPVQVPPLQYMGD